MHKRFSEPSLANIFRNGIMPLARSLARYLVYYWSRTTRKGAHAVQMQFPTDRIQLFDRLPPSVPHPPLSPLVPEALCNNGGHRAQCIVRTYSGRANVHMYLLNVTPPRRSLPYQFLPESRLSVIDEVKFNQRAASWRRNRREEGCRIQHA